MKNLLLKVAVLFVGFLFEQSHAMLSSFSAGAVSSAEAAMFVGVELPAPAPALNETKRRSINIQIQCAINLLLSAHEVREHHARQLWWQVMNEGLESMRRDMGNLLLDCHEKRAVRIVPTLCFGDDKNEGLIEDEVRKNQKQLAVRTIDLIRAYNFDAIILNSFLPKHLMMLAVIADDLGAFCNVIDPRAGSEIYTGLIKVAKQWKSSERTVGMLMGLEQQTRPAPAAAAAATPQNNKMEIE